MKTYKIGILLSYISVASASAAVITPALPQMERSLHVGHGAIEWIVSIFLIGYMLGQFFYSPIANRFGRLSALRFGMTVNIIGVIVCLIASYAASYDGLLVGRLITSLGASAGLSCTFMLLNESLSHDHAKHALSFSTVSFTVGIGLAVVIGGLVTEYFSWEDCFWVLLVHGILMLLLTGLFEETLKTPVKAHIFHILGAYGEALTHRKLFIFAACVGLVSVFSYCFAAAAPFVAEHRLGLSSAEYGYWNILNMVGMFLGAFVSHRLVKKYQSVSILKSAISIMIIGFIIMLVLGVLGSLNAVLFFGITTIVYFVTSWIFPTAAHIASNAIDCKANASGAMNFINMGSAVLVVAIMGYLPFMALWSFIGVVLIFAVLCLLGVVTFPKKRL